MSKIDIAVSDRCINPESYGEICIGCNLCGRFGRKNMWKDRYNHYVEELERAIGCLVDENYQTNLQQKNIAESIIYCGKRLKECIKHMEFEGEE